LDDMKLPNKEEIQSVIETAIQEAVESLNISGLDVSLLIWKLKYVGECSSWDNAKITKGKLYWECLIRYQGQKYYLTERIFIRHEDNLNTIRERVKGCMVFRLKYAPELTNASG